MVREGFRSRIWPLPVIGIVLATALGVLLPEFDALEGRHESSAKAVIA